MIGIGGFQTGSCAGVSRRSFLQAGFSLPAALGLGALGAGGVGSGVRAFGASPDGYGHVRARSIILLWLWGGPSHIDSFDPKPDAPSEYRGPLSTIPTRVPGVHFSELFPRLAARNDRFALVRSHVNHDGGHLPAGSIGLTGTREIAGAHGPNFGSAIGRFRPSELPSFITVGRAPLRDAGGHMKGYGGGAWGKGHDPFPVSCSDSGEVRLPGLELLEGVTPDRLGDRKRLRDALDGIVRRSDAAAAVEGAAPERWNAATARAFDLLASEEGRRAFDLSREQDGTRAAYGQTMFGQSCLLARRLAEVGVPYVQVNWSVYVEPFLGQQTDYGWDTHANHFELMMDRHGPILDRALSALLDDLDGRGLLESTLVLAMGEFGRTPRLNGNLSRDHWPQCYSSIWAGAGVRGGLVLGESDRKAEHPITERIAPEAVGATLLELAGVTAETRARYRVLETARPIDALLA